MGVVLDIFSLSLSGDGQIWTKILSQRAVRRKTINRPNNSNKINGHNKHAKPKRGLFIIFTTLYYLP